MCVCVCLSVSVCMHVCMDANTHKYMCKRTPLYYQLDHVWQHLNGLQWTLYQSEHGHGGGEGEVLFYSVFVLKDFWLQVDWLMRNGFESNSLYLAFSQNTSTFS